MYFSGKDVDSDVKIDQLAADSVALQMGCQPGDLLISVCGTDCRGRGLQHAVDCVLRSQVSFSYPTHSLILLRCLDVPQNVVTRAFS